MRGGDNCRQLVSRSDLCDYPGFCLLRPLDDLRCRPHAHWLLEKVAIPTLAGADLDGRDHMEGVSLRYLFAGPRISDPELYRTWPDPTRNFFPLSAIIASAA